MNTTTAAAEAHVTTATIRLWARRGVIAATKTSGRWIIDAASLAHRIAIGARRLARKAKTLIITAEHCVALGGNRWQRGDMDRVYFNNWASLAGLKTSHYNTGNISSAHFDGELISNNQATQMLASIDKLWFDTADGLFHVRYGWGQCRAVTPRELFHLAVLNIRTAAAAL